MDDKVVYLTFDDGPQEPYTSDILDLLDRYNAKATFFLCGRNIERSPEIVQRIASAGHAIGNHTYSHSFFNTITGSLLDEIEKTSALIKKYTGLDTTIYRSPWGITVPQLRHTLIQKGYKVYNWDISAFDWWSPPPTFIARHIVKRMFSGAVVLLHDGNRTMTGSRRNTVRALEIILRELSRQGYTFAPCKR